MKNLVLKTKVGIQFISPQNILHLHANGAYCIIKTTDGKETKVSKNLNYMHNLLIAYSFFLKVHRSWIINKNHIKAMIKSPKKEVHQFLLMEGGDKIPVPVTANRTLFDELANNPLSQHSLQDTINNLFRLSLEERLYIIEQVLYPSADNEAETEGLNLSLKKQVLLRLPPLSKKKKV